MTVPEPARGDVWDLNFDPTIGREQVGARPTLILSVPATMARHETCERVSYPNGSIPELFTSG